jgi:small subunit ribosomal protein S17
METENPENENVEETPAEETPAAEEAAETVEAAEAQSTGEAEAAEPAEDAPAAPPAPTSKKEQRAAAKHAAASQRPTRTPEERQAERVETRRKKAEARRRRRLQEREKARANRTETPPTPPVEHEHGRKKVRQGVVVSAKPDKTITVRIDTSRRHRRYEKIVRSSQTLHAHDENNDAGEGDTVRIIESRPISKTKRWMLEEVLEKAK